MFYLDFAVKFSSQEYTCPPRIQEENFDFSSKYQIFGYDLTSGKLWNHYLTSKKLRGRPPTWLLNPLLEGKIKKILFCCSELVHQIFGIFFQLGTFQICFRMILANFYCDTPVPPKCPIKSIIFQTILFWTWINWAFTVQTVSLHSNHKCSQYWSVPYLNGSHLSSIEEENNLGHILYIFISLTLGRVQVFCQILSNERGFKKLMLYGNVTQIVLSGLLRILISW